MTHLVLEQGPAAAQASLAQVPPVLEQAPLLAQAPPVLEQALLLAQAPVPEQAQ